MNISHYFINFFSYLDAIRILDFIDIFIVACIVFFVIRLLRRTNSSKVFTGIILLLIVLWLSGQFKLYTVNYILKNTVQIGLIALVILFQPEIRRFLERVGGGESFRNLIYGKQAMATDTSINQIVMAFDDMSRSKTGALVVFERNNSLDEQIRTGTIVNADISGELLKNLFFDKSPLHDGAVIIRDSRIQAAGCMLPLSANSNISRELGMRHRAGIGISEQTDALVCIVSEETGSISVAIGGMLKRHLSREAFEKVIRNELLSGDQPEKKTSFVKSLLKGGRRE